MMKYCTLAFRESTILHKAAGLCPVLQGCILVPFGHHIILNVDLKSSAQDINVGKNFHNPYI